MINTENIVISFINKFGYIGIFFLILIENIFPPIPSEVILTFSGFIAKKANLSIILIIIYATIASLIGALFLYYIGKFNAKLLKKIFKQEKLNKTFSFFNKFGYKSIFIGRLVPIIRSIISIPAGINRMNLSLFIILTIIGSLIWNTILILSGNLLGNEWIVISKFIKKYSYILITIFIISFFYKKK